MSSDVDADKTLQDGEVWAVILNGDAYSSPYLDPENAAETRDKLNEKYPDLSFEVGAHWRPVSEEDGNDSVRVVEGAA